MKLFPHKKITVELQHDTLTTLSDLRRHTKLTETLVSSYTDKDFIGQVNDRGFKIISSEIGRGAVCVFLGDFQHSSGTIEIRIHNAFKIMFSILLLMPVIGFGLAVWTIGFEDSIASILPMIVYILLVRLLVELTFRFISKTGLNKLIRIAGIKVTDSNTRTQQPVGNF
jgi:hypothetical protein